jgi:formate hydrogenlyase subunit 4
MNYGRLSLYLLGAPLLGGLLAGLDRKLSARMQARQGPPLAQPFFDVLKLWRKENLVVRRSQNFYILFFLLLVIFTGALFFAGADLLLVIFALTLAGIFFVLGAYKASSPYSFLGAERELIQMMAYEPMVLLTAVGMYLVTRTFQVQDIARYPGPLILALPGVFLGFLYILQIKFRKSPFDLSSSHHAHQELVRGITTEFSGPTLALIELAHWYETVFLLGWVGLFFASTPILAALAVALTCGLLILVDNLFARWKWQAVLQGAWLVALLLGFGNIVVLSAVSGLAGRPATIAAGARPGLPVVAFAPPTPVAPLPPPAPHSAIPSTGSPW